MNGFSDPVHELRENLHKVEGILGQASLFSFSEDEREALLDQCRRLFQKLDALSGSLLTVGLLGGTGVGKSSVMNALAGALIARTSHLRPATEDVLVYRHREAWVPQGVSEGGVPWREVVHGAEDVRRVVLCDLPDFDSLSPEHRERALAFMEHLDILVWVTSPEKYADGRFHDTIRLAAKAHANFCFVLNKVDRLFYERENPEEGFAELMRMTASFRRHVVESGVAAPLIFAVSAKEGLESPAVSPWNQIEAVRHHVFRERDTKEVAAIKAANVDAEAARLMAEIEAEVQKIAAFSQTLRDLVAEFERDGFRWSEAGGEFFDAWLWGETRGRLLATAEDGSPLVGPGRVVAAISRTWLRGGGAPRGEGFSPPEVPSRALRRELSRLRDRVETAVLRRGLPQAFAQRMKDAVRPDEVWEALRGRWEMVLTQSAASVSLPRFSLFRLFQWAVYLFVFAGLVFSLAGAESASALVREPGLASATGFLMALFPSFFTPAGLAALASYSIINIFLGFRFFGVYKKLLRGWSRKFIESIKAELGDAWDEELRRVIDLLAGYHNELEAGLSAVAVLQREKKGG